MFPDAEIRAHLARVLASKDFVHSPRMCRFLEFIVQKTLDGDPVSLKEYTLGREVFDRDEKYDPRVDSIVRVEAQRLRRKLKRYYDGLGRNEVTRVLFDA